MRTSNFAAAAPGMLTDTLQQLLGQLASVQASVTKDTEAGVVADLDALTARIKAWSQTYEKLAVELEALPEGAPLPPAWDVWMSEGGTLAGELFGLAQKITVPTSKLPSVDDARRAAEAASGGLPMPLLGAGAGYLLGGVMGAVVGAIAGSFLGKKP